MTIAITGATGFVGQTLLEVALAQGLHLRALTRKPQEPRLGLEWVSGDLADKAALANLVQGAEAVIHLAGVTTAQNQAGFETGNVTGTMALVEAMRAAGVPRLLFVSSLSAREPDLSQYGASKKRAERVVQASGLDWTIVRPPTIYGPRDQDLFQLFRSAKWGLVPVPAAGSSSIIHAADLSTLLLALLPGNELVSCQTFEPDDGKAGGWGHYELARAIGWAVGRRPWVLPLSRKAMERAARCDMKLRGSRAKLTLDRVGYMCHPDWVVSPSAHVPESVWKPAIPTRDGLKATANWYRKAGWL